MICQIDIDKNIDITEHDIIEQSSGNFRKVLLRELRLILQDSLRKKLKAFSTDGARISHSEMKNRYFRLKIRLISKISLKTIFFKLP